ncbi:MAG: methyltransferase [Anaerolineae bacterium]
MTDETIFRVLIIAMLATGFTISAYYRSKAARASNERISRREEGTPIMILLRLAGLSVWLSILAYAINSEWMKWSALPLPIGVRWLGAGLSAIAIPLIVWMFRSLGRNVTDTVVTRREHTLVRHGPYRWIRHPLYSFGALLFTGIILMAANWFIVLMGLVGFSILVMRTPIEEEKLIERFGDEYRAYMKQTGRFLPRLGR